MLAAFAKAHLESKAAGTIASTERCLRVPTRVAGHADGKTAPGLRYLAPSARTSPAGRGSGSASAGSACCA